LASPGKIEQIVPPVPAPEQLGVPPVAVEQKDEQMPDEPTMRHVLPLAQSLALVQEPPGGADPASAQTAPLVP
jgi:hypothetical protein